MDQENLSGEVVIVINSVKREERHDFIKQAQQKVDIERQKSQQTNTCSTRKLNLMQLSCPVSQVTRATQTRDLSQEKQDLCENKLSVELLQKSAHPVLSNLQALRNIPRQIHKNPNIKIQYKTEFPLVRSVAVQQFGWSIMSKQNHRQLVDLIWTDTYVTEQLVNRLRPYQKVNHFPYSTQMGRKDFLFANLNKMRQRHKEDYDFLAKTWIFPEDYEKFKYDTTGEKQKQTKFYIVKPVASCQGKGIYLAKKEDILLHTSQNKLLVQEYIQNTMLIDDLKFDVRIYVLIKSLEPLNIFVYKEGLTRLATNEYERPNDQNYRNGRMHLTNYAINKNNPSFVHNMDYRQDNVGHKRSLASLYEEIQKLGHDPQVLKQKIQTIIVKTVLAVYEKMTISQKSHQNHSLVKKSTKNLSSIDSDEKVLFNKEIKTQRVNNQQKKQGKIVNSNKCFELLGFDIMIDDKMEPKLIEINHQPSLASSSPLDHVIKKCLLIDVFNLLNLDQKQKQKYLQSQREADSIGTFRGIQVKGAKKQLGGALTLVRQNQPQLGGFTCIYPVQNKDFMSKYHKIIPILFFSQNQHNKQKRKELSLKTYFPLNQNLEARINRTSLAQKRTQYACHYINMFSNPPTLNYDQNIKSDHTQISQKIDFIKDRERTQQQTQIKIIHSKGCDFNPLQIVPKIKMKKMTEFQVPKKNLNFTIKYKKNKSQSKQIQHENQIIHHHHQVSHLLGQNRSKTPGRLTFYSNNNKTRDKMSPYQIQLTNDHSNNSHHIRQTSQSNQRHTSHQNRIAIKLLKQGTIDQHEKIKNVAYNDFYENNHEQSITHRNKSKELQKYSYPIFEKKSSTIATNSGRESVATVSQTRSIKKNNDFFQKIYEKQLMSRITKMKSMKEKLDSLNKRTLSNKKELNQLQSSKSKKQIEQFPQKINLEFIETPGEKKQKSFSIHKIQSQNNHQHQNQHEQSKQKIYQTIKLMQFEQPKIRRVSHIRMQKSTNLKQRFNNSMEMFKDEGFVSYRRK